ncbi:MAG: hypothetical protein ACLUTO_06835 [Anaerostipes sp.]
MKKLYQSELYTKHHWKIVGTILFLAQIAVIAMCEEDAEKRKQEYKEGIKYLALPILLLLCDIHSDWVYSY